MATVSVRYIVDDVAAAITFYCGNLGLTEVMHHGRLPEPGGWNRFALEVSDLAGTAARLDTP